MDSRIYFHQYRRPRFSNPTYQSSNVQNSITFFNSGNFPQSYTKREYLNRYHQQQNRPVAKMPTTPIDTYHPQDVPLQRQDQPLNRQDLPSYRPQESYARPQQYGLRSQQLPSQSEQRQPISKLSNYGERSLMLDQRSIHDKQTSKFDIINLKPKQYNQDIRQYPRLTLENRDDVYYRRMNEIYNPTPRAKTMQRPTSNIVAGKHTYDLEPKISIDPQQGNNLKYFTPKMLNHMDELQHNLA